jgi:hypothetical protein
MKAVTPSTIETEFSVASVQSAYMGVTELIQGSYESVVSWESPEEFLVLSFQSN